MEWTWNAILLDTRNGRKRESKGWQHLWSAIFDHLSFPPSSDVSEVASSLSRYVLTCSLWRCPRADTANIDGTRNLFRLLEDGKSKTKERNKMKKAALDKIEFSWLFIFFSFLCLFFPFTFLSLLSKWLLKNSFWSLNSWHRDNQKDGQNKFTFQFISLFLEEGKQKNPNQKRQFSRQVVTSIFWWLNDCRKSGAFIPYELIFQDYS